MDEMINQAEHSLRNSNTDLVESTQEVLLDVRTDLAKTNSISVPIAELAALGTTVSSLIPAFRTVTQSTSFATDALYRLADNAAKGTLKVAKKGNLWGALKTPEGASKMAHFQKVGTVSGSSTTVMPINPVIILVAVALHSVEKQLNNIADWKNRSSAFWSRKNNPK